MTTPTFPATDIFTLLKNTAQTIPFVNLLQQPVNVLLGVSDLANTALQGLGIVTIFDLATSVAFDSAVKVVAAASDPKSPLYRFGKLPADLVRASRVAGKPLQDLQNESIILLSSIPEASAATTAVALDAKSIRDLAFYPPYIAALKILKFLYFPQTELGYDPERPDDLIPKSGEYPIEKVQYSTLHMGEIQHNDNLIDVSSPNFAPPDLTTLASIQQTGFKTVATGALLTFTQSWFAQAITLGHLLHSCTLAPGESTRVAVIDWSRKERGNQVDSIAQQDDLVNDSDHTRAIAEVTKGVATEAQTGFSNSNTSAKTDSSGTSTSGDISGGLLGSIFGGPSFTEGSTSSESTSTGHSDAFSTTFGSREVATQSMQNINDRTHQHAHDSRNRRASVVKEVSQSEHESVSTRVIANYNHSHALSINYYEVVQVFRVEVRLAKAEQVIFVPMALPNFSDQNVIRRFQVPLARAALTPQIMRQLITMDQIQLDPEQSTHFSIFGRPLGELLKEALATRSSLTAGANFLSAAAIKSNLSNLATTTARTEAATTGQTPLISSTDSTSPASGGSTASTDHPRLTVTAAEIALPSRLAFRAPSLQQALPVITQTNRVLWDQDHVSRLSGLFNIQVLRPTSNAISLPVDAVIEGAVVEGATSSLPVKPTFRTATGAVITDFGPGQRIESISLQDLTSIGIRGSNPELDYHITVTLTVNRGGIIVPVRLPTVMVPKATPVDTTVVNVKPGGVSADVVKHLNANRMYYAQVVFRSLDATDLALLLSGYGYKVGGTVVPISQVINPKPVRYVGNYIAFTTNIQSGSNPDLDPAWTEFLKKYSINVGNSTNDVVPLGTGGVFAEAVLGRSNCAEKLDITRFWDWKESPAPLQPTEIAAIGTGSRATQENLTPGQLDNSLISQTTPSSLPDPVGTAALLTAIQNGNMFRDQSGLAATIGLTQAALQATQSGAAAAGQTASQNLQSQLQATTERQKTAANMITDLAKTAASVYTMGASGALGGGSSGGGSGSTSQKGALINYFDKTQGAAGGSGPSSSGTGGASGVGGVSGGHSSGGSSGPAGGSGNVSASGGESSGNRGMSSSLEFSQNPAALSAVGGNSDFSKILAKASDMAGSLVESSSTEPSPALNSRKAWPNLDPDKVLPRIAELYQTPYLFQQGSLPLCVVGTFFYHCFVMKPIETAQFAKDLFAGGQGMLGKFKVAPGDDLRNANYLQIFQNTNLKFVPPQADWMLMCSVRDSTNWAFDFEGDPDGSVAVFTAGREINGWYENTGFFSSVKWDPYYTTDPSVATLKTLEKDDKNGIALWIKTKMLRNHFNIDDGWVPSKHTLALTKTPQIDEDANSITLEYWTWGMPPRTLTEKLDFVRDCVMGITVVTV